MNCITWVRINALHAIQEGKQRQPGPQNNCIIIILNERPIEETFSASALRRRRQLQQCLHSGSPLHMCISLALCLKVQTIIVAWPLFSCLVRRLTHTNECKSMHASDQRLLLWSHERNSQEKPSPCQISSQTLYQVTHYSDYKDEMPLQ